ncbi:hypothetical protein DL764_002772 [Monosporascus ibericus]|uniref:Trafficking protein particle complex subunit n=1 Tax=Monosporascus ibericus TaxID=155417 RepID=A0A4V1XBQ3_9PEZI|nr:hypothetical protein DL764_002772 [Monosporascus ibericus]
MSIEASMGVLALIIINKAGGLIYNRNFGEALNKLDTNDYLVLAGTFHGVHAITARLDPLRGRLEAQQQQQAAAQQQLAATTAAAPGQQGGAGAAAATMVPSRAEPPSGLEVMETENFRLQCFNTLTGTKFLLFTDTMQANVDVVARRVYDLYADYVMKNPFYQLEMPVRCDAFERKLTSYIREINSSR